jgi:hypothetical protein
MGEDQRQRLRATAFDVIKMNIIVADAGEELRIPVEICLRFAPIVLLDPILRQGLHVVPTHAVPQIGGVQAIRPFRFAHTGQNTIDFCLRNVDQKRPGRRALRKSIGLRQQPRTCSGDKHAVQCAAGWVPKTNLFIDFGHDFLSSFRPGRPGGDANRRYQKLQRFEFRRKAQNLQRRTSVRRPREHQRPRVRRSQRRASTPWTGLLEYIASFYRLERGSICTFVPFGHGCAPKVLAGIFGALTMGAGCRGQESAAVTAITRWANPRSNVADLAV